MPSMLYSPRKLRGVYWLDRSWLVRAIMPEQGPGDTRCLVRHGDQRNIGRPSGQELVAPGSFTPWRGFAPSEHTAGAMNQEPAQIAVASFGDFPQAFAPAAGGLAWHDAQPGGKLPAVLKIMTITHGGDDGRGGDGTNAVDLHQASGAFIFTDKLTDLSIKGQ